MNLSSPQTFFLSILITITIVIQAASSQNLINSTCRTSAADDPNINYNFCRTSLQAAPASRCASLQGLGMIAIRLVSYNITDSHCHIKQLLRNRTLDSYVKKCLDDCSDLYSDAIPSVKLAMQYYSGKKFGEANIQISSIMDAATTCEDGFKERRGVVLPLTKRNRDTFELSAVALSVMHIIQTGSG